MTHRAPLILLRGGGDLATGVAARLWRGGFGVVVTEIEQPRAVRRLVSLAEAVYTGSVAVEDLRGERVGDAAQASAVLRRSAIPVLVDPIASIRNDLEPAALVDARMTKAEPDLDLSAAPFVVGLGPGFTVGFHAHAVVETNRGHRMGRVYWEGSAEADTGIPDPVAGRGVDRVLRAPAEGVFEATAKIGSLVGAGERLAEVNGSVVTAPFAGALRGLLHAGLEVNEGEKVGDLDPRGDVTICSLISDKALAVGGGVLEALLSQRAIRQQLAASST
ncbi:MAG: selenium-dependent molybdenum cofactor biosynthesis protein YqeB [Anaerolineae bacterium]|nr:MAG: selenium-dependent molybdenum cofactor biosynthesis protein YqeB [Anaerolineae bacterium]